MDALVLDGNTRSALAVTRSLGRRGIRVTVGAESHPSLASTSRFCSGMFKFPLSDYPDTGLLRLVQNLLAQNPGSVVLPMTDIALPLILANRESFGSNIILPFPSFESYAAASDKMQLFRLAEECGVPMPRTLFSADFTARERLLELANRLGYPLVVKPSLSKISTAAGWISTSVRYAANRQELTALLDAEPFCSHPFILQEKIEGAGVGIFLLMNNGEVAARFGHRRLREKPPSGGVSTLCESILPHPLAYESAVSLLQRLNWHGVAMVEMKEDQRDGIPKLIEINARFWGSLQLAITSGVDFPWLLYCLAAGIPFSPNPDYAVGTRLLWELGDLDHLLIRLRRSAAELALPAGAPSRWGALQQYAAGWFDPSIQGEVFRADDPRPFVHELKSYLKDLLK